MYWTNNFNCHNFFLVIVKAFQHLPKCPYKKSDLIGMLKHKDHVYKEEEDDNK